MMLLSVALMTAAMLATALLPTRAAVGPAAGWLLLLLRCVMGFSVGGEYTGVVAYLLEGAPRRRRGLITSSASAASEVGGLLAVGVSALTVACMSEADLDSWGWRIPFFVGAALAGSACGSPARRCRRSPGVRAPAAARHGARSPTPPRPRQPSRRHCPRLRDLGARLDHLLCRDHLRPRVPDLGRLAAASATLVAVDRRRGRRDPRHSAVGATGPTASAGSPCWSASASPARRCRSRCSR